jgi:hypothetical protein
VHRLDSPLAFVEQALGEDCRLVATLDRLLAR